MGLFFKLSGVFFSRLSGGGLSGCYQAAAVCCQGVVRVLSLVSVLSACCQRVVSVLSACCQEVVRRLSGGLSGVVIIFLVLSGDCQWDVRGLSGSCQGLSGGCHRLPLPRRRDRCFLREHLANHVPVRGLSGCCQGVVRVL